MSAGVPDRIPGSLEPEAEPSQGCAARMSLDGEGFGS